MALFQAVALFVVLAALSHVVDCVDSMGVSLGASGDLRHCSSGAYTG